MTFAPWLLVTTTLLAPGPRPDVAPSSSALTPSSSSSFAAATTAAVEEQARPVPPPAQQTSAAPHTFGVGGSIVAGSNGATGSVNYWFTPQVGAQMSVGYYALPNYYSAGSSGHTFQAAPSVMVLLTKPNQSRDVNLRPYLGAGINYVSSSQPATVHTGSSTSGTGGQAFGGVEMSFKDTPQFAITMEAAYFHLPSGFVGTGYIGGMNYLLGVHFYMK